MGHDGHGLFMKWESRLQLNEEDSADAKQKCLILDGILLTLMNVNTRLQIEPKKTTCACVGKLSP